MLGDAGRQRLRAVLADSARLGWLGAGDIDGHIDHAESFAATVRELGGPRNRPLLDLGSGGGVPGLVVAVALESQAVTLLDGSARRCAFLRTAAAMLADLAQLTVVEGRAEELARHPDLAAKFGVVMARSFGRPAVTAECASAFLELGGKLLVSEPPGDGAAARWDPAGLARLGLAGLAISERHGARVAMLTKVCEGEARFPRRVGIPVKRPLW